MPTRPNGVPCWLDLGTSDKDRSTAFYSALLGWTWEDGGADLGGYTTFLKDGQPVAGCMATDGSTGSDGWTIYLATDDVTKLVEASAADGGSVRVPPHPVGDLGQMAFVDDVGGAFVGAWQAGQHTGFAERATHGTPGWFELWTRDFTRSVDFYRSVFGATVEVVGDSDELRYAIILEGDDQAAGIMDAAAFLPEGVPAHWSIYWAVDSVDAAIEHTIQLGGALVVPAEDTPYGRLATCTDSTGAPFKLVQSDADR